MRVYLIDGCFYGTFCAVGEQIARGENAKGRCRNSMYCVCGADVPITREANPQESARFLDMLRREADAARYEINNNL